MICTACWCCESICDCGDEAVLVEAAYCENCGSINEEEELTDGFCEESSCQEAYEEYKEDLMLQILGEQ